MSTENMYYAYSAIDDIKQKGEYGGVVTTIMKYLLENNIVDGVVAVEEGVDIYDAVPCLITKSEDVIKTAGSIHCGTLNLAKFVYKYLDGCRDMKIAVTCKPCDAMTMRELMKKGKIIEDNVIMIGVNCGGTMPPVPTMKMIKDVYELNPKDVIKEEIAKGKLIMETADGEVAFGIEDLEEEGMGRRENCQRCSLKIPSNTDIALGNWGVIGPLAGKATFVETFSDKGAKILQEVIDAGLIAVEEPIEKGVEIREKINNVMLKNSAKKKEEDFAGTTGDIIDVFYKYDEEFSSCMKCYGCREACPLCFCEDCCLEAEGPEWVPGGYTPAAPFFHLTRMVHMVDACTNCGQCSEVCPCEIPVAKVWNTVNNKVKEIYGYQSGFDVDQRIPFTDHISHAKKL
ncbi:Coenzyme F420 hydrogenase/dehydrogenase, beta subunit C-terminal domain [Methanobrevibacter oralis]|uniref:formate dehydrogenase (coenzyme F420) n=1 Tax=Methanobrevibacter oralis TaxID=66851 RepID=A0A166BX45_METOA|nr:Coenzyme F420 hydrogenase/dehydrogenase, beta subunit C-terminal domain [Methanobrevibacter oralis]KZX13904.1 coenzyme F420-reducing hydrogenase subunit beta [Methanobrevibacter oralis]